MATVSKELREKKNQLKIRLVELLECAEKEFDIIVPAEKRDEAAEVKFEYLKNYMRMLDWCYGYADRGYLTIDDTCKNLIDYDVYRCMANPEKYLLTYKYFDHLFNEYGGIDEDSSEGYMCKNIELLINCSMDMLVDGIGYSMLDKINKYLDELK